jgi:hypothetical protein
MCDTCHDKRYLIVERADGREAIERCDACALDITDAGAAILAARDGYLTALAYPFTMTKGTK